MSTRLLLMMLSLFVLDTRGALCSHVRLMDYPTPNSNQALALGHEGLLYSADSGTPDRSMIFNTSDALDAQSAVMGNISLAPDQSYGTITYASDLRLLFMGVYTGYARVESVDPKSGERRLAVALQGTSYGLSYDEGHLFVALTHNGTVGEFAPPQMGPGNWTLVRRFCAGICGSPNSVIGVVVHRQRLYVAHRNPDQLLVFNRSSGELIRQEAAPQAWYIAACGGLLVYPALLDGMLQIRDLQGNILETHGTGNASAAPDDFNRPVGAACEVRGDLIRIYIDEGNNDRISIWDCVNTETTSPTSTPSAAPSSVLSSAPSAQSLCQSAGVSCGPGGAQVSDNITLASLSLVSSDVVVLGPSSSISIQGQALLDGQLNLEADSAPEGLSTLQVISWNSVSGQFLSVSAVAAMQCQQVSVQDVQYAASGLTVVLLKDSSQCTSPLNIPLVAGASVGGVLLIALAIILIYVAWRKSRDKAMFNTIGKALHGAHSL